MTREPHDNSQQQDDDAPDVPLDPWMLDLTRDVAAELDASVDVPRDMMWARIKRARTEADAPDTVPAPAHHSTTVHPGTTVRALRPWRPLRQIAAAAAVLVSGVAIGRYVVPSPTSGAADTLVVATADSATTASRNDPSRVAMNEHLVRTVALLTSVSGTTATRDVQADLAASARELLSTTRLLLDQPQLRDERTRRLLQDLELVLVQVIQARSTAPETERAPRETLRETNLLTRVNALVTASSRNDAAIYGGD